MKQECIDAVNNAVGRSMTDKELKDLESRLSRHLRRNATKDPVAALAMPADQRLMEAATTAAQEFIAEASKKKQRIALQIIATARNEQHFAQFPDQLDGLRHLLAFDADGKAGGLSIETRKKAIERDALRQMLGTLEASNPKFFGLFESKEGVESIVKELFGENSGVAEAKNGAAEFKKVASALRDRYNRNGGDVGELDDWGLPHHHSQYKVANTAKDAWVGDTLPLLNRERYLNEDGSRMDDAQVTEFLGEVWVTIATGGANKGEPGRQGGKGMRANRGNESRQVHYKDATSFMEYQAKYGERSLYEVLVGHIQSTSGEIALLEGLGPNPDAAFKYFKDRAVQMQTVADPKLAGKIQKRAINAENLYNEVAGNRLPVASQFMADNFDTLRNWLVSSRLGSAVISSFSDEATMQLVAHSNNLPAMKLLSNQLSTLNVANRVEERMAQRAGLALNTMISSLNRFGNDGLGSHWSSKLANATMRASGLNAITDARRRAFGVTYMHALGNMVNDTAKLGDLDKYDHRILLSKGITDTDWEVWKLAQKEDWGNGNDAMLTPDAIYQIPDEALAAYGNPKVLRENAATRLLGTILEETDMAVIEPGAKERAMMLSHLQRGTWKGELVRSFFLFKSFPISMISRHWTRGMSAPNTGGKAAYIATLMAATTLLGMASLQTNEVLMGRDPRNMNPAVDGGTKNWIAAMLKGGSLGLYGDFIFSQSSQHGQSPLAAMLGPVAGLSESALGLTQGNLIQAAQGEDTDAGAELVKFVKSNTPGANLWYSKAAIDHLVFQRLQEHFSPGYLSKMKSRAKKEFKQSYWWEPGEALPDRAPDLEAAVGE